jgi:hypothetical protein
MRRHGHVLQGNRTSIEGDVDVARDFIGGNRIGDDVRGHKYTLYVTMPGATTRTPFQAPPLLPNYVPRPEVTEPIRAQLLAPAPAEMLLISAVHGLGGIGKTTVAADLARDPVGARAIR